MHSNKDNAVLVSLFEEFRELIKPAVVDGVPDFTASAMEEQYAGLKELQKRLAAIDTSGWDISRKIDYHVVRAEMNGVEFDHRVLRQWARDPGFYNLSDGIYPRLLVHHSKSLSDWGLYKPTLPLSKGGVLEFRRKLRAIPNIFAQAKMNLTEAAGDLDMCIEVCSDVPVARVDLVKEGADAQILEPNQPVVEWTLSEKVAGPTWYTVRVTRTDGEMAWASPVWIGQTGGEA